MAAKRKALPLPQIISEEDETGVTVMAGRHRARFPAGIELSRYSDKRPARERADEHSELLLRSFKGGRLSTRFKYSQKGAASADEYNERRAKEYARWLMKRDGIEMPTYGAGKCRVVWSGFYSATKTRNVHHWDGNQIHQAYIRRIEAVEWGREEEQYNERKNGRRGAWTHNKWICELRINIPNWDFEPAEPVEEIIADEMPLARVAPAFRIPARFLATSCLVAANDPLPAAPSCAIRVA
jgi:hypothetical protein